LQQGLYKPTATSDRTISFAINRPVRLYGGFFGDETARAQRHATAPTVLSGDIDNNDTNSDGNAVAEIVAHNLGANSYHVLVVGGTGSTGNGVYTPDDTVLDGIVVTGGKADGAASPQTVGGGMYCNARGAGKRCSPQLNRLAFSGNLASFGGGAVFNDGAVGGDSSPRISNATFSGNTAASFGGAIYNNGGGGQSGPGLTHATFRGNSASSGGAVYNLGQGDTTSRPAFRGTIFWGNTAAQGPHVLTDGNAFSTFADIVVEGGCPNGGSGGGTCSGTFVPFDPKLGPLQDNGGATLSHRPGAGSFAIDTMYCVGVADDQRGELRPQGAHCDIGAVEGAGVCRVIPGGAASGTDGSDWGAQAKSLQSALGDASCGEIWLKQGLYKPVVPAAPTPTAAEREVSFAINRPLRLYGGFFGDETARAQRHASAPTVMSGDIDSNDTNTDGNFIAEVTADSLGANSYHVLTIGGAPGATGNGIYTTDDTVLDGIVVTAGKADGAWPHDLGGGLFCNGSGAGKLCSPLLNRATFSGNRASFRGGAAHHAANALGRSSPRYTNATFSGNAATVGGAIYNDGAGGVSGPSLTHVTFRGNSASQFGGAVVTDGAGPNPSFPKFHGTIFWGNTSPFSAGAYTGMNGYSTFADTVADGGCPNGGIGGGTCSGALITADPQLGPLQDNGGYTLTHRPALGSVAIDAMACVGVTEDQRGIARSQGTQCDIGAVESRPTTVQLGSASGLDAMEGQGGLRTLSVPLQIVSGESASLIGFTLVPADGSAGSAADFFSLNGVATFAPNGSGTAVSIVVADDLVEPDEGFQLHVTPVAGLSLHPSLASGVDLMLRNDDSATLTIQSLSEIESAAQVTVGATLDHPVQDGFFFLYAAPAITASVGVDYLPITNDFFHDGLVTNSTTPLQFVVPLIDDTAFEPHERFGLQFGSFTCAFDPCPVQMAGSGGVITITDDEGPAEGLAIFVDNGNDGTIDPGMLTTYRVALRNRGPGVATGVNVSDVLPPTALLNPMWTCTANLGGVCVPAAGAGAIASSVTLPEGGEAILELDAQVGPFDPTLLYVVNLAPPGGYVDTFTEDNTDFDSDIRRTIFRDGLEDAPP
jgi:uncharacterized repeat protein (TIGR01451 family)